jgi:hypothetical protein
LSTFEDADSQKLWAEWAISFAAGWTICGHEFKVICEWGKWTRLLLGEADDWLLEARLTILQKCAKGEMGGKGRSTFRSGRLAFEGRAIGYCGKADDWTKCAKGWMGGKWMIGYGEGIKAIPDQI